MMGGPTSDGEEEHGGPPAPLLTIDEIMSLTRACETRLEGSGVSPAHHWMFSLREVLLDLERFQEAVRAACSQPDVSATRERLQQVAGLALYEVIPHARYHMEELQESLAGNPATEA